MRSVSLEYVFRIVAACRLRNGLSRGAVFHSVCLSQLNDKYGSVFVQGTRSVIYSPPVVPVKLVINSTGCCWQRINLY